MANVDTKSTARWNVDEILADVHRMRRDTSSADGNGETNEVDLILAELRSRPVGKAVSICKTDVFRSMQPSAPAPTPAKPKATQSPKPVPSPIQPATPIKPATAKSTAPVPAHRITADEVLHDMPAVPTGGKRKPNTIFEEIKRQAAENSSPVPAPEVIYRKQESASPTAPPVVQEDNAPTRVDIPIASLATRAEKTRVLSPQKAEHREDELTGQVPLPGFEPPAMPEKKSGEWEAELRAARSKRVQNFVLSGQEEENEPEEDAFSTDETIVDDYESIADAPVIRMDLISRRRSVGLHLGITFLVEVFLLFLGAQTLFFPQLFSDLLTMPVKLVLNAVLTALVILFNASTVFSGLGGLLRLNVDLDTGAAVSLLAALLHNGIMLCVTDAFAASGLYVYNAAAVFALLCNLWGKHRMISRIEQNFELVANESPKKAVALLEDSKEAEDIGHGIAIGEPLVCCEQDTVTVQRYLDHSYVQDPADESAQRLTPYILLAGLVGAIIAFFTAPDSSLSLIHAVTAFSAVSCVCVPVTSLLAGNLPLSRVCRRLREKDVLLTGYDAVYDFADANVLAVDAKALFPKETVSLHQLKTFGNQSIDRALLDAAGLAITAGGPLAHIFDEIIEGQRSILPEVDTLVYEEKMGISGWVAGNRVLIGNRLLMKNHGIALPDENLERRLCKYGQYAVYLATHGSLSAMFVVSYQADQAIVEALQKAVDQGLGLAVYSCDPNITPELIDRLFGVSKHAVSMMGATGRHAFKQVSQPSDACDASLAHLGGAESLVDGVCACQSLYRSIRLAKVIQLTLWVLGLVSSLLMIFLKGLSLLSIATVLGFQVFCVLLILGIPAFFRTNIL